MNIDAGCRCSVKAECRNSDDQSRWLPYSYASCPRILSVEPRHVQKLPTSASAADTSLVSSSDGKKYSILLIYQSLNSFTALSHIASHCMLATAAYTHLPSEA